VSATAAAVLLAAGRSTRLGTPKALLATADGRPLVRALADAARDAGCSPVFVVTGEPSLARAVADAVAGSGATCVPSPRYAEGMGHSIAAGIAALTATADAPARCVLMACDQPAVTATHLAALVARAIAHDGRAVSSYDGIAGIPAVWPRTDWPALAALTGDRGARALLRGDEPSVPLAGGGLDLDTPADVSRWQRRAVGGEPPPR
jgi:CTP:molybdopterin cytidylyltransferase MocA